MVNYISWNSKDQKEIVLQKFPAADLMVWQGLKILSVRKPVNYQLAKPLELDLLVLQQNVYVTPEKLLASFRPKQIIFDSSNAGWYVNWLSPKLKAAGIPVHDVNTLGAYSHFR